MRPGPGVDGGRVADGHRQYEHVYLRDRASVHSDGTRGPAKNARDHRLAERGWRLDPRPRRLHQQSLRLPRRSSQNVPSVQRTWIRLRRRPAGHVHIRSGHCSFVYTPRKNRRRERCAGNAFDIAKTKRALRKVG